MKGLLDLVRRQFARPSPKKTRAGVLDSGELIVVHGNGDVQTFNNSTTDLIENVLLGRRMPYERAPAMEFPVLKDGASQA